MRRLLVVALCACNQVYGLDTTIRDADPFFDAPPRGPYECPKPGKVLTFAPALTQMDVDCTDYSESPVANRALARCRTADNLYNPHSGPIGGPFTRIDELPQATPTTSTNATRMSPEGDLLNLIFNGQLVAQFHVYKLVGGVWTREPNLDPAPVAASHISRGPDRRMLGIATEQSDITEYSFQTGAWKVHRMHRRQTLGVQNARPLWLSVDALRMVYLADRSSVSGPYLAQAERATTDEEFAAPMRLALPVVDDAFVTEDCSRVYFSGLRSLFYAEQP